MTSDPQTRLMQETRGLLAKWQKTGLLDGLKNDIEKSNMAVLLEEQAKHLQRENAMEVLKQMDNSSLPFPKLKRLL